ncbi:MAG: ATP-grasp domain-containing protein [Acidimicrobiia bacterium]|nr:ATP-grasp domain-containing protein [Acidimicrobiia bacterium]
MSIGRLAVINRGEAARRLIRTASELALAGETITTIAFCTDQERRARFVREADDYHVISSEKGLPYLDYEELERALVATKADAAWVGWGFVAEHPQFADLCDRLGVTFVGPSGDVMRLLGDKIGAKQLAEKIGAPVAPWSGGPVGSVAEAERAAAEIGFPLLVKAAAGGGGRGIRFVDDAAHVAEAFERATVEAERTFGDGTVFLEKRLVGAHHVEVQIAADDTGQVWALGVRDCSVQRRNQKLLEESSSPVLDADRERAIKDASVELARAAGYRNVGTVEFLYNPTDDDFAFLEVNTRLQVEHTVTEMTTGADLVKLQLHLATGGLLAGAAPEPIGHAIEARLNAEDPLEGFSPTPGLIDHLDLAHGPGVRVDLGVAEGDVILPDYDSMIAKVIAWGPTREEARIRLLRCLRDTSVIVAGGTTNKSFLTRLLSSQAFIDGTADTGWLDRLTATGQHLERTNLDLALMVATIDAFDQETSLERSTFYLWAARGRPQSATPGSRRIESRIDGRSYEVNAAQTSPSHYRLTLDGRQVDVAVERHGPQESRLHVGGRAHRVVSSIDGLDHRVEVDGIALRVSRDAAGLVRTPAPALVVSIAVEPGDVVADGEAVAVVESMKMETALTSPIAGTVREVYVTANTQVDAGTPLLRLDSDEGGSEGRSAGERIRFDDRVAPTPDSPGPAEQCLELLDRMRWLVLGFEADDQARVVDRYRRTRVGAAAAEPLIRAELDVLTAFADLCALGRNRPDFELAAHELHSPELYFHRYLRSLDADAEGLPGSFRTKLARALGHFGLTQLERSPELEIWAHRLFQAQQHVAERRPIAMAVLGQLAAVTTADDADQPISDALRDEVRSTLDHLVEATQIRHANVGDQARTVRFRIFDEPTMAQTRRRVMANMHQHLAAIDRETDDRQDHVDALARCPYPLVGLLAGHEPGTGFERFAPLLEVLTARNYQIREIEEVARVGHDDAPSLVARYDRPGDGQRTNAVATLADASALAAALSRIATASARTGDEDGRLVADIYVSLEPAIDDAAALAARAEAALEGIQLSDRLDRLAFSGAGEDGQPVAVTFRRSGPGEPWAEDRPLRGLHPMIAVRLGIARLRPNFELEPLPASPGTHLFRAVARTDPGDERLFAAAEVRDLAPVHDDDGRLAGLPGLEQAYTGCVDGLRRAQIDRDGGGRLLWNRILIYVWQQVDFDVADAAFVVVNLEPLGRGLGIEEVDIQAKLRQPDGSFAERLVRVAPQPGGRPVLDVTEVPSLPLRPVNDYERKVVGCRQRGTVYPYELIPAIKGAGGGFVEHEVLPDGTMGPVDRDPGLNTAAIVAGEVSTPTDRYPEGIRRMVLLGDPTKSLGSLAEAECRVIIGALDRAEAEGIPVEWFALSSGARIAMDSGTENMDWIAAALRRIVTFTQAGGEINIVVTGINVGAQPYWNAEATMLQHTKGILVMTPESAMVLTGKQALDISGGVSAEDNFGIGGYDRVMGPNGQGQYWARDLAGACEVLFAHYDHAYRAPGERFPRRTATTDPVDRDVRSDSHDVDGSDFTTVGDIFSDLANPGRKKPFDIRTLMRSVIDRDSKPLERWTAMQHAETAAVLDAELGGYATTLIGIESRPLPRHGSLPADGPDHWTAGTLFPQSSRKVARAINAASGNRPVVFLANLSGFDGSPESLRGLQLEYGAEIGRAIVNFDGPIVFCVVSRYHGGAFVVFSSALNDNMQVLAVEGTYASVLGGAPAAAVVFAGEVRKRVQLDPRVSQLEAAVRGAAAEDRPGLQAELAQVIDVVRAEKLGDLAAEFDAVHSIERAQQVGSVDRIITAAALRPELIAAVERGMARCS